MRSCNMFNLTKKVALVTGAGSGIGRAIAQRFAQAGAKVFVADINEAAAQETVELIETTEGNALSVTLDVADVSSVAAAAKKIGALDLLVNNAGIGHVGTILETNAEDMERLYRVNVGGVFNVTKAFIPGMLERKSGSIINIASIGGVVAVRDRFAYVTTKFAVVGMTKQTALDHSHSGGALQLHLPRSRRDAVCAGATQGIPRSRGSLSRDELHSIDRADGSA